MYKQEKEKYGIKVFSLFVLNEYFRLESIVLMHYSFPQLRKKRNSAKIDVEKYLVSERNNV